MVKEQRALVKRSTILFVEDIENAMIDCFFERQVIRETHRKKEYPLMEQCESSNALLFLYIFTFYMESEFELDHYTSIP